MESEDNSPALWTRVIAGWLILLSLTKVTMANEPIAVLSFAGTDRLTEDLRLLTELSGSAKVEEQALSWLSRTSGIDNLDGMDATRPLGAVIETDGSIVNPVAFFPVNDAQTLLASLSSAVGPATRLERGLWKIDQAEFSGFVREHDGWMFFAQNAAALEDLPDPVSVLGNLPQQYDSALRLNLQQVPDVFRQFLIDLVRTLLREDLAQRADESAAMHSLRSSWLRFEFDVFERIVSESEQVTVGYNVDAPSRRAEFDLHFRPLPSTSLAKALRNLHQTETRFSTLIDGNAAVVAHATLSMGTPEIKRTTAHLNDLRDPVLDLIASTQMIQADDDREMLARLVATMFDTAEATITSGRLDMAMLASGDSPPVTVFAAAHVGTSENLKQLIERISETTTSGSLWQLRLNVVELTSRVEGEGQNQDASSPKQIQVHALEFEAENAHVLRRLFGDDAKLYLALGNDVVWMGIGPETLTKLRRIASGQVPTADKASDSDDLQTALPPVSAELKLGHIASVAAQASDNFLWKFWMGSIAQGLQSADDTVAFQLHADQQELHAHLAMEEGVLRALAVALSMRLANEEPPTGLPK